MVVDDASITVPMIMTVPASIIILRRPSLSPRKKLIMAPTTQPIYIMSVTAGKKLIIYTGKTNVE